MSAPIAEGLQKIPTGRLAVWFVPCHAGGMEYLPHLALASAALLVALAISRVLGKRLFRPALPYSRRPSLLTAGEMRFYRTLVHAVPPGLAVMVKVRLMDVVDVPAAS